MSEERELVNVYLLEAEEDGIIYHYLATGRGVYNYKPGTVLRIVNFDDFEEAHPYDTEVVCHMTIWADGEEYEMLEQIGRILLNQEKMHKVKARRIYVDD